MLRIFNRPSLLLCKNASRSIYKNTQFQQRSGVATFNKSTNYHERYFKSLPFISLALAGALYCSTSINNEQQFPKPIRPSNTAEKKVLDMPKGTDLVSRSLTDHPDAETFEIGLFLTSQEEYRRELAQDRAQELSRCPKIFKWVIRLKFFVSDYVMEPILTGVRFIELSMIFLPVIIGYPIISILGPKVKNKGDRWGKLVWNKFFKYCLELAGPCFIKMGQWAASRTDIFSKNFCHELESLHSNSKPHSFPQTKKIIADSFGAELESVFEEFVEKPIGVGSIAQVHVGKLSEAYLRRVEGEVGEIERERSKTMLDESYSAKLLDELKERFSLYKYHRPKSHQWVAVKVMHPGVEEKIDRDLKIMSFFANIINLVPTMEWLSFPEEVQQFAMFMKLQLDLRIEGVNLNKFAKNFEHKEIREKYNLINKVKLQIKFPKPYLKCSNRHVLVEEYMHAVPIATILELTDMVKERLAENNGKDKTQEKNFMKLNKILSNEILDSFLQMLILDNFIHSDLHPGNICVRFFKIDKNDQELFGSPEDSREVTLDMQTVTTELLKLDRADSSYEDLLNSFNKLFEEGYRPEVCYLDAGLVTELNNHDRVNFLELFKALSMFDGYRAGELMVERSRNPEGAKDPEIFALKVQRLVDTVKDRAFTLGNISIGDLLDKMLGMVRYHHVKMEPDFVNVVVAILLLEGIGRQLDPELDLFASAIPILRRVNVKDAKLLAGSSTTADILRFALIWAALETRQLIHATIQDIYYLVCTDGLAPNH
ncbi:Cqd1 protein [Saccharomycopsis crataegensis]|uniref:Cqd1 protein n=1 Tax=Saccharomycopsis crataegensis TaxID=43959 RepID=A0AAV5QHV4_9ASCO|nr:Cqd1 protein [Saccharomycopsis crataegensis]